MIKNEYLKVAEVSKLYNVSKRNVRRVINNLIESTNTKLLVKDLNGHWSIHRLLLPKFKPKRKKKSKFYALTIDPCHHYSIKEINEIMNFIIDNVGDKIEINYSIEQKKSNNQNHIHCYILSGKRKKIIESIKIGFSNVSYKATEIFDLEGWKSYITKDGNNILTLKSNG